MKVNGCPHLFAKVGVYAGTSGYSVSECEFFVSLMVSILRDKNVTRSLDREHVSH